MKCLACDEILTDKEATRKNTSGYFIELCDPCLEYVKGDIEIIESIEADRKEYE